MSCYRPVRSVARTIGMAFAIACIALAQSGAAALLPERHSCSMTAPQPALETSTHSHMTMTDDCCGGQMTADDCANHVMVTAGTSCCRIQREQSAPRQQSSVIADRTDVSLATAPAVRRSVVQAHAAPPAELAAHTAPVLDQKADLRI